MMRLERCPRSFKISAGCLMLLLSVAAQLQNALALPPRPSFVFGTSVATGSEISVGAAARPKPRIVQRPFAKVAKEWLRKDLLSQCTEQWRNATIDHFSTNPPPGDDTTFPQRYFVCSNHWKRRGPDGGSGPIFFYLGNEADVTLYLNNTGLMWESAADFGAMLVFAEHRYYGESLPYTKNLKKHMSYLITEQAMADYAQLIMELKDQYDAHDSAVIGFGGSYGGMLAAWMRLKYPHALDGAISASAPIWNFLGETPAFDSGSFAKGTTYDASEVAGSAPTCADNVRATWDVLRIYGRDDEGRKFLADGLQLCPSVSLKDKDDVLALREWLGGAWDYMAMGNYPYPSSYITNGNGLLPAFPVRAACQFLDSRNPSDQELLEAMSLAVGVYYNHTGDLDCYDPFAGTDPDTDRTEDFWDFQWCAEMLMPFSKDGVDDMFWSDAFDLDAAVKACQERWGVTPRPLWATTEWGGRRIEAGSNIVFSNGLLDPWHGGGVLEDISDSMPAVIIPEGAHHLDLMFSHPDDPLSVIEVRKFQQDAIRDWVQQAAQRNQARTAAAAAAGLQQAAQRNQAREAAAAAAGVQHQGRQQQGRQTVQEGQGVEGAAGGCMGRRVVGAVRQWLTGLAGWFGRVVEVGGGEAAMGAEQGPQQRESGGRRWGRGYGGVVEA